MLGSRRKPTETFVEHQRRSTNKVLSILINMQLETFPTLVLRRVHALAVAVQELVPDGHERVRKAVRSDLQPVPTILPLHDSKGKSDVRAIWIQRAVVETPRSTL